MGISDTLNEKIDKPGLAGWALPIMISIFCFSLFSSGQTMISTPNAASITKITGALLMAIGGGIGVYCLYLLYTKIANNTTNKHSKKNYKPWRP